VSVVGEAPAPTPGLAGGGRTPVYMDALRDIDVNLGPGLVAELAAFLAPLLESSRWLCGRSFELGCGLMMEAIGSGGQALSGTRTLDPLLTIQVATEEQEGTDDPSSPSDPGDSVV
jgi:hypothetical protein